MKEETRALMMSVDEHDQQTWSMFNPTLTINQHYWTVTKTDLFNISFTLNYLQLVCSEMIDH